MLSNSWKKITAVASESYGEYSTHSNRSSSSLETWTAGHPMNVSMPLLVTWTSSSVLICPGMQSSPVPFISTLCTEETVLRVHGRTNLSSMK